MTSHGDQDMQNKTKTISYSGYCLLEKIRLNDIKQEP